ncbi:hypothetical protein ACH4TV_24270 [Streptomyces sp. NPDC020898]|uniref:hypothetical protein n=1 Tax=Streptomyces sp. NPDC020898 TaxID=3365101 RepID=UPI0037BC4A5A
MDLHSAVAIGSRLHRQSDVVRGPKHELLVLAQPNRLRIHEVPVDRVDDPDSRVDIVRTALDDLRGIRRMLRGSLTGRARIPVPHRRPAQSSQSPTGAPQHTSSPAPSLEYAS